MRISYLSGSAIPSRNASSVHVMKICQALAREGHEVTLFARRGVALCADPFSFYGVEPCFTLERAYRPPVRALGGAVYALDVARRLRRRDRADVLLARHPYCLAITAHLGVPMIFDAHEPPATVLETSIMRWLIRHGHLRRLVVISNALRQEYQRLFPWMDGGRLLVAHCGADDLHAPTCPHAGIEWPGRYVCPRVGYVGSLYPGKGMEVVTALAERMPHVDFHVVGGETEDLKRWKQFITAPNLYFHGYVANAVLFNYYARLDIVLAPYQRRVALRGGRGDIARWMSPLKIFEYMAAGKPVVASDLPVLREVLEDGREALLVPPDDVEAWAAAIERLLASPELRQRLSRSAHQKFMRQFTWQARARKMLHGALR